MDRYDIYRGDLDQLLETIFKLQPRIALDEFILNSAGVSDERDFDFDLRWSEPMLAIDAELIIAWADEDPVPHYPALGRAVPLFITENNGAVTSSSETFSRLLDRAPDKLAFLGEFDQHMVPTGWSGSLATVPRSRRASLNSLAAYTDTMPRNWALDAQRRHELGAEAERQRDSMWEESFECPRRGQGRQIICS